jgi:UDP-N-acetylglucosamine 2-epimerase (non-hydrolysing)
MKIINVVGARPNFMKISPLIRAMNEKKKSIEHILVHTGQHYDRSMSDDFFEQLGIPYPDINLEVGSGSHAVQTANVMIAFEKVLLEYKPDFIVVVGDVNSTIACTLVASKLGVRIAHVEAGLRSFDRTMPEEINRILTDAISDMLFTTEESGNENLKKEGLPDEKIYFVGNVMIDTLIHCLGNLPDELPFQDIKENEYAVITLHRPSNVDNPVILKKILAAFHEISKRLKLVIPLHPRTLKNIQLFGLTSELNSINENAIITGPIGYMQMLRLVRASRMVITDSGGIQEETTYLGVPCITMRNNTERPSTISMGTNILVGADTEKLLQIVAQSISIPFRKGAVPPLWDGKASIRIVDSLINKT